MRMHIERRPAERIRADWAGDMGEVVDPDTWELLKVRVFASRLPYSSHLFVEGFCKTDEETCAAAHVHMFAFFGGSAPILTTGNTKTAFAKNVKDELILNDRCRRISEHRRCAVVPARVRRPRDNGAIGMGVGIIESQAMLVLRNRRFISLCDFNGTLADRVEKINFHLFQKRGVFLWLCQVRVAGIIPMMARVFQGPGNGALPCSSPQPATRRRAGRPSSRRR